MSILGTFVAVACFILALVAAYQIGRLNANMRLLVVLRHMNEHPPGDPGDEIRVGWLQAIGTILDHPTMFDNGKANR